MRKDDTDIHRGSGNVFADLGVSQPEEMLLKAGIVVELRRLMAARDLTQTATAELVGMGQADVSKLFAGSLRGYSVERLMKMLMAFGQDVRIVSQPVTDAAEPRISFTAMVRASSLGTTGRNRVRDRKDKGGIDTILEPANAKR